MKIEKLNEKSKNINFKIDILFQIFEKRWQHRL